MGSSVKRHRVLSGLVKERGWQSGAEIGVNRGRLLFHLLDHAPQLHMIGVDSWLPGDPLFPDHVQVGAEVIRRAKQYGSRVTILHGASVAMAALVPDGSLDFIFIDADHSREAVLADIAAWVPKVREGGGILGHDIDFESVRIAVTEKFGDNYSILPDDVWMINQRN